MSTTEKTWRECSIPVKIKPTIPVAGIRIMSNIVVRIVWLSNAIKSLVNNFSSTNNVAREKTILSISGKYMVKGKEVKSDSKRGQMILDAAEANSPELMP